MVEENFILVKDGQAAHLFWHVGTAAHHVAVQGGSDGEF